MEMENGKKDPEASKQSNQPLQRVWWVLCARLNEGVVNICKSLAWIKLSGKKSE